MHFEILSLVFLIAMAGATNVRRCKDKPFPISVEIEGCETVPCNVIKGSTAVMYVHFVGTKGGSKNVQAKVQATALGITAPYDLPKDVADVCSNLLNGARCPIYASDNAVYKFNFYIDTYYPEIGVKVEVSLVNEDNESIACFIADVKVKKGAPNKQLE